MTLLTDLNILRGSSYCWDNYDNTTFHVFPLKGAPDASTLPEYLVPVGVLAVLHEKLPAALKAQLSATNKNFGLRFATSNEVFATIDYYTQGAVEFDDVLDIPRTMYKIREFYEAPRYPGQFRFQAVLLTLETIETAEESLVFVVDSELRIVSALESELEQRYPGFKKRYALGLELDVPFDDLIQHVFKQAPLVVTSNTFNDITFE